jgi:selenocysteine lyase/cysteine desulfurase
VTITRPGATRGPLALSFDLDAIRARIPILAHAIPLNGCSQAPQTAETRDAAERYLESWATRGMEWEEWVAEVERARAAFARLVGADVDEIAITSSVSEAASSLASALDFGADRDTVVASGMEFPTVAHVWLAQRRRGARVRWVDVVDPLGDGVIPAEAWRDAIDERTRVVSAALAWYQNGALQDVAEIARLARERGAISFIDAYQALGTRPFDARALGVDALACGALKFLMGTPGIAFLYVRRELAERLEPGVTGWFGRANPFAFDARALDWAAGARRFDTGTPPVLPAYVARAGIELLERTGLERIGAWNAALARRAADVGRELGLARLGTEDIAARAPTTAFRVRGDSHEVEVRLRARGVIASARGPVVRIAPHFYNTMDDVERGVVLLAESIEG